MQLRHRVDKNNNSDRVLIIGLADNVTAITSMLCLSSEIQLNDKNAPEWIELIPTGEFQSKNETKPLHLKDPAAVIAASFEDGRPLPIDYDHALDRLADNGAPGRAAGWITKIEERDGSLWGKVDWTDSGAAAIASREYRYISPVFLYLKKSRDVQVVLRAALTNNPALTMKALADSAGQTKEPDMDEETLKKFCTVLGLADDADEKTVMAALAKAIASRATLRQAIADKLGLAKAVGDDADLIDALAKLTADNTGGTSGDDVETVAALCETVKLLQTEINSLKSASATSGATDAVEQAMRDGKISPASKQWAIGYASSDRAGFDEYIKNQPALLDSSGVPLTGDAPPADGGLTKFEKKVCAMTGVTEDEFKKSKGA